MAHDGRRGAGGSDEPLPALHRVPAGAPDHPRPVLDRSTPPCSSSPTCSGRGFVDTFVAGQRARAAVRGGRPDHPRRELRGARHCGVEHVLRADRARHRRGPAVPAHGAPRAGRVLRVGPRHLGRRRGHGDDPHRHGQRAHGRTGLGAALRGARPDGVAPAAPARRSTGATARWASPPPAAQGLGRSITPLAVWAGYWSLAAVLFVFPDNRTRTSVSSAIVGMAPGQPGWFSHFLTSLGNQFSTTGTQTAWVLAACRSSSASGRCWPGGRAGSCSPAPCFPSCSGSPGRGWSATSSPCR